jgi:hypothetical protein
MISIINHWMDLYQKLNAIVDNNLNFYLIIGQAMIYAQAANVITPNEKDTQTKEYFFRVRKTFFLIILGAVALNTLLQFVVFDDHMFWIRVTGVPLILACALIDKIWLRIAIGINYIVLTIKLVFIQ